MIDLAMICVGGLLGSGHCVGMCGPIGAHGCWTDDALAHESSAATDFQRRPDLYVCHDRRDGRICRHADGRSRSDHGQPAGGVGDTCRSFVDGPRTYFRRTDFLATFQTAAGLPHSRSAGSIHARPAALSELFGRRLYRLSSVRTRVRLCCACGQFGHGMGRFSPHGRFRRRHGAAASGGWGRRLAADIDHARAGIAHRRLLCDRDGRCIAGSRRWFPQAPAGEVAAGCPMCR